MDCRFTDFMGFTEGHRTEMNNLWYDVLSEMTDAMNQYFEYDIAQSYTLSDYIQENKLVDKENAYFWEWLEEEGLKYLAKTDQLFPVTEDVEDFLNYRKMILEMDIESGSVNNFILSVTELLKSVANFVEEYLISFGQETIFKSGFKDVKVPVDFLLQNKVPTIEDNWKVLKSSADTQAELLIYI